MAVFVVLAMIGALFGGCVYGKNLWGNRVVQGELKSYQAGETFRFPVTRSKQFYLQYSDVPGETMGRDEMLFTVPFERDRKAIARQVKALEKRYGKVPAGLLAPTYRPPEKSVNGELYLPYRVEKGDILEFYDERSYFHLVFYDDWSRFYLADMHFVR